MLNKKFVYAIHYFAIQKTAHKYNQQTHSSQQNKKIVLATAAYFKVSTTVRLQRHKKADEWYFELQRKVQQVATNYKK